MAGANADYVINIATSFEGEQTAAQLDQLTSQLVAGGKNAGVFTDAVAKVSSQLVAAKAATVAANAALAEGNDRYAALEKAANAASIAFEKAQKSGVVPPGVEAAYQAATAAVNDQAAALKKLEATAKDASGTEDKLSSTLKNVRVLQDTTNKSFAQGTESLGKLQGGLSAIGGPIGNLGSKLVAPVKGFQELSSTMGASGAASLLAASGIGLVAVAVAAVTVAVLAGTVAIAAWAIGLGDAARAQSLNLQALVASNAAYGAVTDSLEDLTYDTGQSQTALLGLTKKLIDAKVSAAKLPDALRAAALAETALGAGGADQFLTDIKDAKLSVDTFAATAQNKFGGIVQKQMLGLTAQSARFHQNISNLFGGLNIEPALTGLQKLVALFDDSTAAGQAIKVVFEGVFQPLINQVDKAATVVEAFVLGVLIGLTKLYIQAKPVIKAIGEFFGFDNPATADTMAEITAVAEKLVPILVILAAIFGVIATVVGVALVAALASLAAPFVLIAAQVYAVIAVFGLLRDAWGAITDYLGSISLSDIGNQMLQGLVDGILGAGPAVLKALGGVVTGAITSAKSLLGIHSPSKVFAEIGQDTGAGMAVGLDDSTDDVQASMAAVVEPPAPTPASAPGGAATPATASGGAAGAAKQSPDLSGAVFNFYGVKDAADAKESFGEMLTAFLEGDAAKLGNAKMATP